MKTIELANGVKMPMIGYGTLQIPPDQSEDCLLQAFLSGYRLIDTAASYLNEEGIGRAIKKSGIERKELFIVTKVWIQDSGYENTLKAFEKSIHQLNVDYLDLYLIHQPFGDYYGSYRALEKLYDEGKVKAIGVCNFSSDRLVDLCMNCRIPPMVNQIEYHPFFQQKDLKEVAEEYGCIIQAWGPFNEGQRDIFHHPKLVNLAKKYDKTVAQVILRWHLQNNIPTIPKTVNEERMKDNLKIFDFQLDDKDLMVIDSMNIGYSEIINHRSYTTAKWLNKYKIHE